MIKRSKLTIRHSHIQQIIDHAIDGLPNEVCGLLGGHNSAAEILVPVANRSSTPTIAYELERQAMVETIMGFQREGREVVAIYHSHPHGEAIPSERDIAEATWPDAVYIIVGLRDVNVPDVRGWSIAHGRVEPIEIYVHSDQI